MSVLLTCKVTFLYSAVPSHSDCSKLHCSLKAMMFVLLTCKGSVVRPVPSHSDCSKLHCSLKAMMFVLLTCKGSVVRPVPSHSDCSKLHCSLKAMMFVLLTCKGSVVRPVPSHSDCSKRCTFHPLTDLFFPMPSRLLSVVAFSHAAITARRKVSNIFTCVCSQVLVYTYFHG